MNTFTAESLTSTNKNAFALAQSMASVVFSGMQKYAELNLGATKSALFETGEDFISALGATTATDALAAQASLVKPLIEKSISYSRSMYDISAETNAALAELAEAQFAEVQKTTLASIDALARNAPGGSESLVAVLKSSMVAGQKVIDTAKQSARKAVEQAEHQVAAVTDTALQNVKTTTRRK